ncbi:Segregation and condensation protein B [Candidatus Tiddalikarchaeum anstoanum]|nr:Segregation and condensation protein B [Candidatus Tiddalikarchaeum anstoanum]
MSNIKKRVEALLFIISEGLKIKELAERINVPEEEITKALKELNDGYKERDSAITLINYNDLYRLSVDRSLISNVTELIPQEFSKSLIKTLSVVAWKNGITQGEVVRIRGNKAYDHINKLKEYDFIKLEPFGKTFKLVLSDKFFEYFNITKGEEKFIFNDEDEDMHGETSKSE